MSILSFLTGKKPAHANRGLRVGAIPGAIVIHSVKTGQTITITPALADELVKELPSMAQLARNLSAGAAK